MDAHGANVRQLTKNWGDFLRSWSPDGKHIAFIRGVQLAEGLPGSDIYVIEADGSVLRRLTDGLRTRKSSVDPFWSPDGRQIAFVEWDWQEGRADFSCTPGATISTVATEGGAPRRLTSYFPGLNSPAWSPDGRHIAFVADRNDCGDEAPRQLYLVPAGGREERVVPFDAQPDGGLAWQPLPDEKG